MQRAWASRTWEFARIAARAQPCGHLSGIFQARFADFFVRELGRSGEPCRLTELPRTAPESCEILEFVLYKENRTTADALQQLSGASGIPVSAARWPGAKTAGR